jgi:hypothetical protein
VRRVTLSGFAMMLLVFASFAWWQGCGLDPPKEPPPPIELPTFPPESPEDVLANMAYAYNNFEYEHYYPLIHPEFQFFIWSGDVGVIPSDLAPDGRWSQPTEVELAENMMDQNFVPTDDNGDPAPGLQIDDMQMEISLGSDTTTTNLEGDVPWGTVQAFVNFDLTVDTRGTDIYIVHSRPLFYFAPDTTATPWTWTLWRVDDGENLNNP